MTKAYIPRLNSHSQGKGQMKTYWLHGAREVESEAERAAVAELHAESETLREAKARDREINIEFANPAAGLRPNRPSRSPSVASTNTDRSKSSASDVPIGGFELDRLK